MEKIHNNLNIENLTKTEWFNQFNRYQKEEILKGLEKDLNVSIYAKTEFDWEQMKQILFGLQDNLDVSLYAKSDLDWQEMKEIRLKLIKESTLK